MKDSKQSPFKKIGQLLLMQKSIFGSNTGRDSNGDALELLARYLLVTPHEKILDTLTIKRKARHEAATDVNLVELSLNELEHFVESGQAKRKQLELIAIERFHVPRGSMRSFSSVDILKEKIISLIENEKAHISINHMAQRPPGQK